MDTTGVAGTNLSNIVYTSASNNHACAVDTSGYVYCWGYNGSGQLGNGSTTENDYPVQVQGVSGGFLSGIGSQ